MTYLDYNATTPLRPGVLDAMRPWLEGDFGNPSSTHSLGQKARHAVDAARARMAALLHADPSEITFTSGATESINTALRGLSDPRRLRLLTGVSEHHATLRCAAFLGPRGAEVEHLGVDSEGRLDLGQLKLWLAKGEGKVSLVSLMHANNETGAWADLEAVGALVKGAGALFHVDAAQSFGKVPVDLGRIPADALSLSAHKFGGPKGVGLLYIRKGIELRSPLILGGEQESRRRGGTENVAGIVGMAEAASQACASLESEGPRLAGLRDRLQEGLLAKIPGLKINAGEGPRVPNTLSVVVPGVESDMLIMAMDRRGFMVSAGSACAAGAVEPSHVLKALGRSDAEARCGLRFSVGWGNSEPDIDSAVEACFQAFQGFQKAGL